MINVLVRTSNRPMYFQECIESIKRQTYKEVNLIVANDANDSYCRGYNPIKVERVEKTQARIDGARHFPYNAYLNEMFGRCKPGYVLVLDDDDVLASKTALEQIMRQAKDNRTIFWKAMVSGRIVPSNRISELDAPNRRDVAMIGFAFSTLWLPLIHIAPYKQADWRLAVDLWHWSDVVWINEILTKTQSLTDGAGLRKDKA